MRAFLSPRSFTRTFAPLTLALLALAPACGGGTGGEGGAGGSSNTGGEAWATVVTVSILGAGRVDATGKSSSESCTRDTKGALSGTCATQWQAGDPPTLKASSVDPSWTFTQWSDSKSGETLGTTPTFKVEEGATLEITALFEQGGGMTTTSTGTCGGPDCGCVGGVCPEVVADKLPSVAGLTEQGDELFWLGTVHKVNKAGGTPAQIVDGAVSSYVVDATDVYWIDGSATSLWTSKLDGSGDKIVTALDGQQYPHALAADATDLYFTTMVKKPGGDCTAITRVPKAGGDKVVVAEACDFSKQHKPYAIALSATDVLWGTIAMPSGGSLYSAPKSGSGAIASTLATNMNSPVTRIVVDGSTAFYMQNGIRKMDVGDPKSVVQIGTTMTNIASFAVDADNVYVAGGTGVSKVDRKTDEETQIAGDPGLTLVVDATHVYWGSGGNGMAKILKLAK